MGSSALALVQPHPFDQDLLIKFVTKLLGKIGESLYIELIKRFEEKQKECFIYHATLLPIIKYVRSRIREYYEEEKRQKQIK